MQVQTISPNTNIEAEKRILGRMAAADIFLCCTFVVLLLQFRTPGGDAEMRAFLGTGASCNIETLLLPIRSTNSLHFVFRYLGARSFYISSPMRNPRLCSFDYEVYLLKNRCRWVLCEIALFFMYRVNKFGWVSTILKPEKKEGNKGIICIFLSYFLISETQIVIGMSFPIFVTMKPL